jgi:cell division protein FtsI (penicillin-binding protein 3)
MAQPKKAKKKNLKQVAFTRFMLVVAFFVLWMGGISVRLVHLQVTQHDWHKRESQRRRENVKQVQMLRGTIYDRNERALAMSVRVKTLFADAKEISDPDATARAVAKALGVDAKPLIAQLQEAKAANRRFLPLVKKLDEDVVLRINKSLDDGSVRKSDLPNYAGLHWRDDQTRKYPYGTLAAQVIGFNSSDEEGRAGIELSQDELLKGAVIKNLQTRDRLGRVYDETEPDRDPPSDVLLTIDAGLQNIVDTALENGVRAANAKGGMAVAIKVKTGEILAMSNYPTYNPNTIIDSESDYISNRAVQSVYSPGSAFKIVAYGSGLEKGFFSPDDQIDSGNGTITVGKHKFADGHPVGRVSYLEALARSSNVCAIKTGLRVGKDDFYGMIKKMGFGGRTGIELPAETAGLVNKPERWNGDSLASMSIGYEIGVTALQMASAFATIANNGVRIQPHIIKEIRPADQKDRKVTESLQTEVLSPTSARGLRKMLRQVVLTGTGKRAQLDGYSSAGKTGTAWKVNTKTKAVDSSLYVSSFIGMAPAENPEVVIAVVMDEPRVGARDGGMVSAPVFKEIAQKMLPALNVPMDMPRKAESQVAEAIDEAPITEVPDSTIKGGANKDTAGKASKESSKPATEVPKVKAPDIKDKNKATAGKNTSAGKTQPIKNATDRTKLET